MLVKEERNRKYLADLFAGPFPGHALLYVPPAVPRDELGDYTLSDRPVREWVPYYVKDYQDRVHSLEVLDDDSVPYVYLITHTGLFAAAFGCPIHIYHGLDTNPAARPILQTPQQADLLPQASLGTPLFERFFDLARLLRQELGPDVPLSVPDLQSPFDIAALIWEKLSFYTAMLDHPDSIHRLVDKTHHLLKSFLLTFKAEFPNGILAHYPSTWAPPELGCWLSEDEVGAFNQAMFEQFCLPSLADLSNTFGGLFMHCCANAEHQYAGFKKIPNLRGLNRNFYDLSPKRAIDAFSGQTVLMMAGTAEEKLHEMLDLAHPDTRFLFVIDYFSLEEVKPLYERLRLRMPRISPTPVGSGMEGGKV